MRSIDIDVHEKQLTPGTPAIPATPLTVITIPAFKPTQGEEIKILPQK